VDLKWILLYNDYVYDIGENGFIRRRKGKRIVKKNRVLTILFCMMLSVMLCMAFTACGGSDKDQASDTDQAQAEEEAAAEDEAEAEELLNDAELEKKEEAMIEAEENAEETPVKTDTKYEDFVGTWKTVTEMADDAFGGFEITFHKNKKFDAVITGEEEKGKCTFADGVTTAQNEVVNAQFWFNDEGIMVVLDENGAMAMLKKIK